MERKFLFRLAIFTCISKLKLTDIGAKWWLPKFKIYSGRSKEIGYTASSKRRQHGYFWDPAKVEAGDEEALKAVREAERIVEEQVSKGGAAFAVAAGRRLEKLDPQVEETVVIPRIVGG